MITRHPASQTIIVHSNGFMDGMQVDQYREKLRLLIDEGCRTLIFDLEKTPFISSSGLGLLVECYNKMNRLQGMFRMVNVGSGVLALIKQARLDQLLLDGAEFQPPEPATALPYDPLHLMMNEEIQVMSRLGRALEDALRERNPGSIRHCLLDSPAQTLEARCGALFLYDARTNTLQPDHWHDRNGQAPPAAFHARPVKLDRLEWRVLQDDAPSWGVVNAHSAEDSLAASLGLDYYLAAPIRGRDRVHGFIILEPAPDKRPLANLLGPLVGSFLRLGTLILELATSVPSPPESEPSHILLAELARLTLMGALTSGLGHQFNNKLSPMAGYAQILRERNGLPESTTRCLDRMAQSTIEMQHSVERLRQVRRQRRHNGEQIGLHHVINLAVQSLRPHLDIEKVNLTLELPELPPVKGHPEQLLETLLVVLHCAATGGATLLEDRWVQIDACVQEANVRLVIEDNGAPPDHFLTPQDSDPLANDMGLSRGAIFSYMIAQTHISRMRGRIDIQARGDGGKRVVIELPLHAQAPASLGDTQ